MKNIIIICALLLSGISIAQTKTYKGAWFEIKYPASFKAKGSIKSATSGSGFDSAVFDSPDGKVQFYIFSPQWSGTAHDIEIKSSEKLVNSETKESGDKELSWWTISAKNNSYTRSYQETKEHNTNWIFGIKYKDDASLKKYKKQYLNFKKSLVQFAD